MSTSTLAAALPFLDGGPKDLLAEGDAEDARRAVAAARRAFDGEGPWRRMKPAERPCGRWTTPSRPTSRSPWNSPINNVLWKVAPVLASGCTMVLKPAEEASLVALRIDELLAGVGVPGGVVNIVTGFGETVGATLTEHPDVDKVTFTGSTVSGQHIVRAAAGNLKRVTLELGGKSPDVVFADADLRRAVAGASMGVFANSGQACCAGTRIFVEGPIYQDFVDAASEYAAQL
jgi:aldehyde dehydrogenase (NAD+)